MYLNIQEEEEITDFAPEKYLWIHVNTVFMLCR